MVMTLPVHELVYVAVPLCASTSVKASMYGLMIQHNYEGLKRSGEPIPMHVHYPYRALRPTDYGTMDDPFVFTVIRDPLERFLSLWSYKVMTEKRIVTANTKRRKDRHGLLRGAVIDLVKLDNLPTATPSLEQFVMEFDEYSARYGFLDQLMRPASEFLGDDLLVYDEIYTMDRIPELEATIRERTGVAEYYIPKVKATSAENQVSPDDLSDRAFDSLMERLEPHYAEMPDHFSRPDRTSRAGTQTKKAS